MKRKQIIKHKPYEQHVSHHPPRRRKRHLHPVWHNPLQEKTKGKVSLPQQEVCRWCDQHHLYATGPAAAFLTMHAVR